MDEVRGSSPLRSTRVPLVGTSIYLDNCTIDCCKIRVVPRNNLSSLTDERFFVKGEAAIVRNPVPLNGTGL